MPKVISEEQYRKELLDTVAEPGAWWIGVAQDLVNIPGKHRFIHERHGQNVYMARYRLDLGPLPLGRVYLHNLVREDNDDAPHDHPHGDDQKAFDTRILSGGYTEEMPTERYLDIFKPRMYGPHSRDLELHTRKAGEGVRHPPNGFHRIVSVQENTWTLVVLGPKRKSWGFYPAGKPWVPWWEYLNLPKPVGEDAFDGT